MGGNFKQPKGTKKNQPKPGNPKAGSRLASRKKLNPNALRDAERRKGNKGHPKGEVDPVPTTPENRARSTPICGASRSGKSTSGPGICCQPAGWGTDHKGVGRCKWHGGDSPAYEHHLVAETAKANAMIYGPPRKLTSDQAIQEELERTAGAIHYLEDIIRDLNSADELFTREGNFVSKNPYLGQLQQEREHLVRVAKACKDMNINERRTQLIEESGRQIAAVFLAFINDPELGLDVMQRIRAKELAKKHLGTIVSVETVDARELSA